MILETFRYMERKHEQDVRKFHLMKRLRAKAVGANAASPVNPGIRDRSELWQAAANSIE